MAQVITCIAMSNVLVVGTFYIANTRHNTLFFDALDHYTQVCQIPLLTQQITSFVVEKEGKRRGKREGRRGKGKEVFDQNSVRIAEASIAQFARERASGWYAKTRRPMSKCVPEIELSRKTYSTNVLEGVGYTQTPFQIIFSHFLFWVVVLFMGLIWVTHNSRSRL